MNRNVYWKIRKFMLNIVFVIKKVLFRVSERKDYEKDKLPFHLNILKTIIFQLVQGLFFTLICIKLDHLFLAKTECEKIDLTVFENIILGGMGVAGVILGLYCSNVASIYSAKYTNAPESLAQTFRNDIVTNSCIKEIIGYVIICIILLFGCIIKIDFSICSIVLLLFLTLRMVIAFSITGNRTYTLSNTFQLANFHYLRIETILRKVTNRNCFSKDANFQNHFQKLCGYHLSALSDISKYGRDIPKTQNSAMQKFIVHNLSLIDGYWTTKPCIKYNSKWFRETANYKQWHYASDTEIEMAINKGRFLEPDEKRDIWWFESELLKINCLCLEKMLSDQDFEAVHGYLLNMISISKLAVQINGVTYWVEQLQKVQSLILKSVKDLSCNTENGYEEVLSSNFDVLCCAFLNVVIEINVRLSQLDLENEYKKAKSILKYSTCKFENHIYINNLDCEKMYEKIGAERSIEKRQITPDWFIEQTVAHQIYNQLRQWHGALIGLANNVFNLGRQLCDSKNIASAAVVFSNCVALNKKCKITLVHLERIVSELKQKHFEKSIVWEELNLKDLKNKLRALEIYIPKYLIKCSEDFAISHWDMREKSPDFLGFCYNYLCEELISAIETDDFNKFETIYTDFFNLVLLYQEYVRSNVVKHKETHMQKIVFHVAVAPIVEYGMISGLGILWGELTENGNWKMLIENSLKNFIDNHYEEGKNIIQKIVEYVKVYRDGIIGIGNRDILQGGWKLRIANAMKKNEKFNITYHGFGGGKLKTDSELLSAFIGEVYELSFQLGNIEDIYLILCVNPYLNDEQKYKSKTGWEEKIGEPEQK